MLAWARDLRLVLDVGEEDRLAAMRLDEFASFIVPGADAAERDLTAQWAAFICLVDDRFDRSGLGSRPDEVRVLFGRLLGVFTAGGTADVHSGPVAALDDLWRRTAPRMPPQWRVRFVADYRDFALATCEEAAGRNARGRLALCDYLALRRRTITALPMADIVECTASAPWPDLPGGDTRLRTLRLAAADVAGWTNDLVSAEEDLRTERENVVTVWGREHGCSLSTARERVVRMRDNRLRDFHTLAAALAAGEGVPGPDRVPVRRYVWALGSFVSATLLWLGVTGRFEARWMPARHGVPTPLD
ncbi:terpene synthase family protein [Streptomyces sp. NBC_01637]|uniref:terpene synthase family protein n=1 Tax=unclassified Streptomyces TaxID=2593676 RepID=UPI003867ABB4|nr:terpene synthase family protein [Streptomyces sp. NBC_01653]WTD87534.1 terpene synthase family protein [Streptomyces sp. NBC_01637]